MIFKEFFFVGVWGGLESIKYSPVSKDLKASKGFCRYGPIP